MKTMTKSGPLRGIERSPDAGGLSSSVLGRIGEQMRSSEPADQDEGQSKAGDEKGQEDHSEAQSVPGLAAVLSPDGAPDGGTKDVSSPCDELAYVAVPSSLQDVGRSCQAQELAPGSSSCPSRVTGSSGASLAEEKGQKKEIWTAATIEELVAIARVNPKAKTASGKNEVMIDSSDDDGSTDEDVQFCDSGAGVGSMEAPATNENKTTMKANTPQRRSGEVTSKLASLSSGKQESCDKTEADSKLDKSKGKE